MFPRQLFVLLILSLFAVFVTDTNAQEFALRKVSFPRSAQSEKVQAHFLHGVAAPRSFWNPVALQACLKRGDDGLEKIQPLTHAPTQKKWNESILVTGERDAVGSRLYPFWLRSKFSEPPVDWENQAVWIAALRNVALVYASYYRDPPITEANDKLISFTEAAEGKGSPQIILLSGGSEERTLPAGQMAPDSGAEWIFLKASWFCRNFSENYLLEPAHGSKVGPPHGEAQEPFNDAEDISDIVVAVPIEFGDLNRLYELIFHAEGGFR